MVRRPTPADIEALVPISAVREPSRLVTAVYRAYDEGERLLYVGISYRLVRRLQGHARASVWWRDMASMDIDWHSTVWHARTAELIAIHTEAPMYNQEGTKPPRFMKRSRALYLDSIRTSPDPEGALREALSRKSLVPGLSLLQELVVGAFDGSLNVDLPSQQDRF